VSFSESFRPSRPVRLIAGTPAGGGQDRAARALAAAITASSGIEVEVANLPGRGGGAAWASLADQPGRADLLAISSPTLVTNAINAAAEPAVADLTQLALLCTEYIVFVSATVTSPDDLLAQLAGGSAVVAIATALGNVNHVAVATVTRHAGGDPHGVGVRAFGSARTAVAETLEGRATAAAVSAASVLPEWEAGAVHALAVSAPRRLEGPLATVPTWHELGVPCEMGTWRGVVAPPGLPAAAIGFWDGCLGEAVASHPWRAALTEHLWSDTYLPSTEATRFIAEEDRRLRAALGEMELTGG
jgi:putative tricarboxylic transport membrane protein